MRPSFREKLAIQLLLGRAEVTEIESLGGADSPQGAGHGAPPAAGEGTQASIVGTDWRLSFSEDWSLRDRPYAESLSPNSRTIHSTSCLHI